jgi:hypothetical protein
MSNHRTAQVPRNLMGRKLTISPTPVIRNASHHAFHESSLWIGSEERPLWLLLQHPSIRMCKHQNNRQAIQSSSNSLWPSAYANVSTKTLNSKFSILSYLQFLLQQCRFTPRRKGYRHPLDGTLGGPQSWCVKRKISCPCLESNFDCPFHSLSDVRITVHLHLLPRSGMVHIFTLPLPIL